MKIKWLFLGIIFSQIFENRRQGGHLLEVDLAEGMASFQAATELTFIIPDTPAFNKVNLMNAP
ncbi:MAG: acetolactate decarboxylase [Chlamydiia bacterium]|nr:acetolactate decarboxylase [Chlamydiia bacterium]